MTITLQPTVDILATVAARPGGALLRRLRRGDERRRTQRGRKAPAQAAAADRRQPGAGCLRQRRQRGCPVRRCRGRTRCRGWASSRSRGAWSRKSRGACRSAPAATSAMTARTARIALKVLDERIRPHLPAYATPGSAGMDLRACIDAPITLAPGARRARSDRRRDPRRRSRTRRGDPAPLGPRPQARHRARQSRRVDRLRLSGAADGELLEPRARLRIRCNRIERLAQLVIVPVVQAEFDDRRRFRGQRAGGRRIRQYGALTRVKSRKGRWRTGTDHACLGRAAGRRAAVRRTDVVCPLFTARLFTAKTKGPSAEGPFISDGIGVNRSCQACTIITITSGRNPAETLPAWRRPRRPVGI